MLLVRLGGGNGFGPRGSAKEKDVDDEHCSWINTSFNTTGEYRSLIFYDDREYCLSSLDLSLHRSLTSWLARQMRREDWGGYQLNYGSCVYTLGLTRELFNWCLERNYNTALCQQTLSIFIDPSSCRRLDKTQTADDYFSPFCLQWNVLTRRPLLLSILIIFINQKLMRPKPPTPPMTAILIDYTW